MPKGLVLNELIPEFNIPDQDGVLKSLSELKGK